MTKTIPWLIDFKEAVDQASRENKMVLLDFFNPQCIGCQQMDAVTFSDEKVIDFINNNFIPLRIASSEEQYAVEFMVKWTPRLFVMDSVGLVHHSTLGFFIPEQFIPSLELGLAKADFDMDHLNQCKKHLDRILEEYPQSSSAPEAVYLHGVTGYKLFGNGELLKDAYMKLKDRYAESEWVQRALPYRLL